MSDTNDSQTVKAGARTYFFDLKESKDGNAYLVITESRPKGESDEWERSRLLVFPDHAQEFLEAT
ncbi:MAG: DUF3276 family protein, partial [Candidatus Zixiibacteriota bacterium]